MESSETSLNPASEPQSSKPSLYSVATPHFAALTQSMGLIAVICYLFGYVIVNTYLGRYGIASKNPLSLQYVSSGMTLVLIIAFFAATTAVKVYRMNEDAQVIFSRRPKRVNAAVWFAVALLCILASLTMSIIFNAAATTMVLLSQSSKWLAGALGIFVVIDFQFVFFGLYRRFPVPGILFSAGLCCAIFWIAASREDAKDFKSLLWYFGGLAGALLFMLEIDKMFKSTTPTRVVSGAVVLLLLAVGYGQGMYEKIPQGMGGGKPVAVQLLVSPQDTNNLQQLMNLKSSLSEEVELIADDGDELILLAPQQNGTKRVFRLSKRIVDGVIPTESKSVPKRP